MRNISAPQLIEESANKLDVTVILVAKFAFVGENPNELSIRKGDIIKLLDRPGNGWLLVKFVDKLERPGLVPASYVEILLNDLLKPISNQWLLEQAPLLQKTIISDCLLYNERYWYRLDLFYSDGSARFLCKYYSDFYELHVSLQKSFGTLPNLPQPISPKAVEMNLKRRCYELNNYTELLIKNADILHSGTWNHWVDVSSNIGFVVQNYSECNLSSLEISQNVQPNLTQVT